MSKPFLLAGFARPIPDVKTFVHPVFTISMHPGEFFVQEVDKEEKEICAFVPVKFEHADELVLLNNFPRLIMHVGYSPLYGFEYLEEAAEERWVMFAPRFLMVSELDILRRAEVLSIHDTPPPVKRFLEAGHVARFARDMSAEDGDLLFSSPLPLIKFLL